MILIIGLGNPGKSYEKTRHNVGFLILDSLLKKLTNVKASIWQEEKKFNSFIAKVSNDLILAKPLSFMNSSGMPVAKIVNYYKVPISNLFIVHDDVDLPLGKVKISIGQGSAGHKGVESIIQSLSTKDFIRIRAGVGKDQKISTDKFVLMPFERSEEGKLKQLVKKTIDAFEIILKEGVEKAATRFNQ